MADNSEATGEYCDYCKDHLNAYICDDCTKKYCGCGPNCDCLDPESRTIGRTI